MSRHGKENPKEKRSRLSRYLRTLDKWKTDKGGGGGHDCRRTMVEDWSVGRDGKKKAKKKTGRRRLVKAPSS